MRQIGLLSLLLGLMVALATNSLAQPSQEAFQDRTMSLLRQRHHDDTHRQQPVQPQEQVVTTAINLEIDNIRTSFVPNYSNKVYINHDERSLEDGGDFGDLWFLEDPSNWKASEAVTFIFVAILLSILLCFAICCCCRCRFSLWDVFAIFCCWEICCDDGRMISGALDTALV